MPLATCAAGMLGRCPHLLLDLQGRPVDDVMWSLAVSDPESPGRNEDFRNRQSCCSTEAFNAPAVRRHWDRLLPLLARTPAGG